MFAVEGKYQEVFKVLFTITFIYLFMYLFARVVGGGTTHP